MLKLIDLKEYSKNPRKISEERFVKLTDSLKKLGDLSGIIVNINTNEVIGGNQRTKAFLTDRDSYVIEVTKKFPEPRTDGTVAYGYVSRDKGLPTEQKFSYREVQWTEDQAEEANIVANKITGQWDYDVLANKFDSDKLLNYGFTEKELFGDVFNMPPIFNPNLNPGSDDSLVTGKDMTDAEREMQERLVHASKFIDITCPQCGHDFQINS
jgi:hypothetical protein